MKDVYEKCPIFENEKYLLRFTELSDARDLVNVYGDKKALPYFNSDNCHGDNFYYPDLERMIQVIEFWLKSYESKWLVRWAIIDKKLAKAIGSIELFHRVADDDFNGVGVLRLDVSNEYETSDVISEVLSLIFPSTYELFHCEEVITKIPNYAIERTIAATKFGFKQSEKLLIGTMDGYAYKDYWSIKR